MLVLARRFDWQPTVVDLVRVWLETAFEGGRHSRRLEKIAEIEANVIRAKAIVVPNFLPDCSDKKLGDTHLPITCGWLT